MRSTTSIRVTALALAATLTLAACSTAKKTVAAVMPDRVEQAVSVNAYSGGGARSRECLMRAMYFESIRSSNEGLLAVGTVVMNRVESDKFPNDVCSVVGQRKQFAPGVMSRQMRGDTADLERLAGDILDGKRHPGVKRAKFFHQAGLKFPYNNMHYVLVAGGNAFYEKRSRRR